MIMILSWSCTNCPQILAILPVAIDEFSIGLMYGWVSPTIKYLRTPNDDLYLNNDEISWVASLHELGRFVGPFVVMLLSKFIGRKRFLTITAAVYVVAWSGILFTRNLLVLCLARLAVGIAIGFSDVVSCIYIGEIATSDVRGKFLTIVHSTYIGGQLAAYTLGMYLSYNSHAAFILIFSALYLFSSLLLVETPHYLITVEKEESAKKNLEKVRSKINNASNVQNEFEQLKKFLEAEDKNKTKLVDAFKDIVNIKILCLALTIAVLGHTTGYFVITYYSNLIFPTNELLTSNQFTMIYGLTQLISVIASSAIIDLYGRRSLLLIFSSSTVLLHGATTVLYFGQEKLGLDIPGFSWIVFVTAVSYSTLFTFGCSPVNFVLRSELFLPDLKSIGCSLSVLLQSSFIFVQTKMFMLITDVYGVYLNFLFFTIAAAIIFLVVYFKLPETKGKTLAQIQTHFKNTY